jgi:hypothetical protein
MVFATKDMKKLITRVGISFIFITFGAWEIIDPAYWSGFVPKFLEGLVDLFLAVRVHGIILLILGLGIMSGFQQKKFGIASTLTMGSVVFSLLVNFGFSDILVRDIVILLFASTLIFEK